MSSLYVPPLQNGNSCETFTPKHDDTIAHYLNTHGNGNGPCTPIAEKDIDDAGKVLEFEFDCVSNDCPDSRELDSPRYARSTISTIYNTPMNSKNKPNSRYSLLGASYNDDDMFNTPGSIHSTNRRRGITPSSTGRKSIITGEDYLIAHRGRNRGYYDDAPSSASESQGNGCNSTRVKYNTLEDDAIKQHVKKHKGDELAICGTKSIWEELVKVWHVIGKEKGFEVHMYGYSDHNVIKYPVI